MTTFELEGIKDLLPVESARQEALRQVLLSCFSKWGYQSIQPSTLEHLSVLERGRPELIDPAFKVVDNNGQLLALRPDNTLSIARLVATRLRSAKRPLRLCYSSSIFRQDPKSSDLGREIRQFGVEMMGTLSEGVSSLESTVKTNLEVLSVLLDLLEELQIPQYKVVLSYADSLSQIFDYLSSEEVRRLETYVQEGDILSAQQLLSDPQVLWSLTGGEDILQDLSLGDDVQCELQSVLKLSQVFGSDKFVIDFLTVPDKDFYTGLYFEIVVPGVGQPIGRGGRYNNLISSYGESEPAIGFSLDGDLLLQLALNDSILSAEPEFLVGLDLDDLSQDQLIRSICERRK